MDLLEAYDAEEPTEEQEERRKWYEECIGDDEGVGLSGDVRFKWDKEEVNRELTGVLSR